MTIYGGTNQSERNGFRPWDTRVSGWNKQGTCIASSKQSRLPAALTLGAAAANPLVPPQHYEGSDHTTNRTKAIYTRVTPQEKQHIQVRARQCGLSVSEYLRQRALGYTPRAIPPEDLHLLRTELQRLRKAGRAPDADQAIQGVLDEIRDNFILPGRDS